MIQVCYYKGCGVIYSEKEPLSDKRKTHGLCPKHLEISLKEIKAEMEKLMDTIGSVRVLTVEDGTLFRQLFKEALHDRFPSVEIYEAIDGEEELLQVETLRPNLIFMDRCRSQDLIIRTFSSAMVTSSVYSLSNRLI